MLLKSEVTRIGMLPLPGYFLIFFSFEETGKVVTNILQASGHFRFIQFAFRAQQKFKMAKFYTWGNSYCKFI